jgi:LysM repeat protein
VFSVLALHVAGLTTLLLTQGCKREVPVDSDLQTDVPSLDTNAMYYADTNLPPALPPPESAYVPPVEPVAPPVTTPPAAMASEYVVKSGDTFTSIASQNNTTVKAMEAANPGVDSRRLKIGQKLVLPAPGASTAPAAAVATTGDNLYTVKSGDTLSRIATRNNTTVNELKSLNGLTTDRINVGQKLKLPPPPAPAPVPMTEPLPAVPLAPTLPPAR